MVVFIFLTFAGRGQSSVSISVITGGEYFIGANRRTGSGTSFSASDGSFDSDMESALALDLNITSLDVGEHRVGVRYRDDLNQWSEAMLTDLVIYEDTESTTPAPAASGYTGISGITGGEYFIGADRFRQEVERVSAHRTEVLIQIWRVHWHWI